MVTCSICDVPVPLPLKLYLMPAAVTWLGSHACPVIGLWFVLNNSLFHSHSLDFTATMFYAEKENQKEMKQRRIPKSIHSTEEGELTFTEYVYIF
jgi:hypothetical protein